MRTPPPNSGPSLLLPIMLLGLGCSGMKRDDPATAGAEGERGTAGEAVTAVRSCPTPSATGAIAMARDVVYVTRAARPLHLDVTWPEGPAGTALPLVLLLHGGSWTGGSRESMAGEARALARLGYVAATVEYRLTQGGRNLFPAAVADVRCAVRHLRAGAARYRIAPGRVGAIGYSAGGHLAGMLGAAADVPGLDEPCAITTGRAQEADARVQAVVSYAGPQDLRVNGPYTQEQADIVTNFLGVFPGDDPARAALASPVTHVRAGAPPFLFVHGRRDDLVPVEQSRRMTAALRRVGTPATALELSGRHEFVGLATSGNAQVRCTTEAFLARWLRESGG